MIDAIEALVKDKNIRFLYCSFVEMSGVPKAKLVPITQLRETVSDGASFAGFACGNIGQGPADPDIVSVPDLRSFMHLPWKPEFAWVIGDVAVNGKPWPYCPRNILNRQIERARAMGFVLNVGVEPEFMLLRRHADDFVAADALDFMAKPCYDLGTLDRNAELITRIIGILQELCWEPYAADHEDANGQYEINWKYSDALTTADRTVFFRWMVRMIAEQYGYHATFAPKPFTHLTGNGCHYHMSLQNIESGKNAFYDSTDSLGLSSLARQFLGGVLTHARALSAVTNPTVNSYKRLLRHAPNSGATWAPVFVTYGSANRTQMVRIPGSGRLECRTPDGAANPYLACATMLAAGLDGIENNLSPGLPNESDLYAVSDSYLQTHKIQFLPENLKEAVEALEQDVKICDAFGAEYAGYYIATKRREWEEFHRTVDRWERAHYLQIY
jgi:glutamine synthetase